MDVNLQVFYTPSRLLMRNGARASGVVGNADAAMRGMSPGDARASPGGAGRAAGRGACAIDQSGRGRVVVLDGDLADVVVRAGRARSGRCARQAGLQAGRNAGLAMTPDGTIAAGVGDDRGLTVYLSRPGRRHVRSRTPTAMRRLVAAWAAAGVPTC